MILLNLNKFFKEFDGNFKNILAAKCFIYSSECVFNSDRNFLEFKKLRTLILTGLHVKSFKKSLYFNYFSNISKSSLNKFFLLINFLKNTKNSHAFLMLDRPVAANGAPKPSDSRSAPGSIPSNKVADTMSFMC